jgi:hypothetical protein
MGPHETNPGKMWRADAHENVNGSDKAAGPPPDNTGPVKDTGKSRMLIIGAITVRVLPSGHAYRATVTASNPARGLALLQI